MFWIHVCTHVSVAQVRNRIKLILEQDTRSSRITDPSKRMLRKWQQRVVDQLEVFL